MRKKELVRALETYQLAFSVHELIIEKARRELTPLCTTEEHVETGVCRALTLLENGYNSMKSAGKI